MILLSRLLFALLLLFIPWDGDVRWWHWPVWGVLGTLFLVVTVKAIASGLRGPPAAGDPPPGAAAAPPPPVEPGG